MTDIRSSGKDNSFAKLAEETRTMAALIRRGLMVRHGRDNIGFLWMVLEPMLLTVGVMTVWSFLKPPYEHGVQIIAFVLTGYMPLTLWRHLTNSTIFIMRRNHQIFYHRGVNVYNLVASTQIVEFIGTTVAFGVIYFVLVSTSMSMPMHDPILVLYGWLLMAAISFPVGILLAAITEWNELSERFIQPFQYLMVPMCGCFYMIEWLPYGAQEYALYVPLVHAFEMLRSGYFGPGTPVHYSISYPLVVSAVIFLIAIECLRRARETFDM